MDALEVDKETPDSAATVIFFSEAPEKYEKTGEIVNQCNLMTSKVKS